MFIGFNDFRSVPVLEKLRKAATEFEHRFGRPPEWCLASVDNAEGFSAQNAVATEPLTLRVDGQANLRDATFYMGYDGPLVMDRLHGLPRRDGERPCLTRWYGACRCAPGSCVELDPPLGGSKP